MDRFVTIEMEQLSLEEEYRLLKLKYPKVNAKELHNIAEIVTATRNECKEGGKLSNCISTRTSIECAGLIYDGFNLAEAATVAFYPHFSPDGGIDSERTYIKQIVQKYCPETEDKKALFGEGDIAKKPK